VNEYAVHQIFAECAVLVLQIVMRYKCCRFECTHCLCQSDKPRVLAQCVCVVEQPKLRVHFISVLYCDNLHLFCAKECSRFSQAKVLISLPA